MTVSICKCSVATEKQVQVLTPLSIFRRVPTILPFFIAGCELDDDQSGASDDCPQWLGFCCPDEHVCKPNIGACGKTAINCN